MRAVVQRVSRAELRVDGEVVGQIERGALALVAVVKGDGAQDLDWMKRKLLGLRFFPDDEGKMNRSIADFGGGLLLVSQFTLAANTQKGNRASFTSAAPPDEGLRLFDYFVEKAGEQVPDLQTGEFGADMKVHLVNDGPVTFWLQVPPAA